MAQYLALIYEDEARWAAGGPEVDAGLAAHGEFGERFASSIVGGEALQPTATATSIRPDGNGGMTVTDGPWAESKEALGGYYLIEAPDLDAALEVAKAVPHPFGGIELRPIMVFG